jgi:plasmid stabilization system protein ParE
MKIIWTPLALERLQTIADYIARDNPQAAIQWVDAVFDKTELLAANPNLGRSVPELDKPEFRELIFGNYRIIYRKDPTAIWILTVRHCRQSFAAIESAATGVD